jgi:hypothetical protein
MVVTPKKASSKIKIRILCAVSMMGLMLGCTHANISSAPQMIGGKAVFTYQSRANFGHQPFYKIMYWGRRQEGFDSTEESVTVEKMIPGYSHWYDRRTKSEYPSTDKRFFARMCYDLNP